MPKSEHPESARPGSARPTKGGSLPACDMVSMKTLGHARPRTAAERLEWNRRTLRLSPRYGRWCERGVRRFRTWEEAGSSS